MAHDFGAEDEFAHFVVGQGIEFPAGFGFDEGDRPFGRFVFDDDLGEGVGSVDGDGAEGDVVEAFELNPFFLDAVGGDLGEGELGEVGSGVFDEDFDGEVVEDGELGDFDRAGFGGE